MAIKREKREDLMQDATAYARRLMIQNSQTGEAVFVGIRPQGGWSVYFGEDPVYQFNAQCQLRRAHFANQNYAASDGRLLLLDRNRSGGHVEIRRIHADESERTILADCPKRLKELVELLHTNAVETAKRFPADDQELVKDLIKLVRAAGVVPQIADTTNA